MKDYVVGFAFNFTGENLLLIRKNRPEFMVGRLGGVGGKVEDADTKQAIEHATRALPPGTPNFLLPTGVIAKDAALIAMHREFHEEAGLWVTKWTHFATVINENNGEPYRLFFFYASISIENATTQTDEQLVTVPAFFLPSDVLPDLNWLVPMAIDHKFREATTVYEIKLT